MSADWRVARWFDGSRRWLALASEDLLAGGRSAAMEGDRWFLGALRGLGAGAAQAQRGADDLARALVTQWMLRRPSFLRPRPARERIERTLRAEAKRHGFDVEGDAFRVFSSKIALLLELVYTGAVPLDAISFDGATESEPGEPSGPSEPSEPVVVEAEDALTSATAALACAPAALIAT